MPTDGHRPFRFEARGPFNVTGEAGALWPEEADEERTSPLGGA